MPGKQGGKAKPLKAHRRIKTKKMRQMPHLNKNKEKNKLL